MDTRDKIASGADCAPRLAGLRLSCPALRVVSGYFDPLLAGHAATLEEAAAGAPALAVVVLDPPGAILPARARAELVASLASVSLVLLPSAGDSIPADASLEARQLAMRERFIAHVHERQS